MTSHPEPGEPRDPYGMSPAAHISAGGHFPGTTGRRAQVAAPPPPYAVAFVPASPIRHAVPWAIALPGIKISATCRAEAWVSIISRHPVVWTALDPMACEDCAVAIAASREQS
ncbi:hypothetical protein Sme01_65100 [Sphaerisporangium melleum]|uniref:Uncharacterized protein n=1 Tax=Sphaerisporangium melleum TaxID=321316 RepID=A0A917RFB0_9ACTN|nr:hypothetical protein [Sphaerisporangium melleum]GGL03654.1 hypothetical protein GCM10007964_52200 [Sphaerisporangium melleum]GII74034.1 hypothetical protein Sme01_65100 [Sphaerisporangium melleum]